MKKNLIKSIQISNLQEADAVLMSAGTEDLFEKAHKVGDIHQNGKWVWTEYSPGKFDWRSKGGVVKKVSSKKSPIKELRGGALKKEYERIKAEEYPNSYDGVTVILYRKPNTEDGDVDYDYNPAEDKSYLAQEEVEYFDSVKDVKQYLKENNLYANRFFIAYEAYLNNEKGDYIEHYNDLTASSAKENLMSLIVNGKSLSK